MCESLVASRQLNTVIVLIAFSSFVLSMMSIRCTVIIIIIHCIYMPMTILLDFCCILWNVGRTNRDGNQSPLQMCIQFQMVELFCFFFSLVSISFFSISNCHFEFGKIKINLSLCCIWWQMGFCLLQTKGLHKIFWTSIVCA